MDEIVTGIGTVNIDNRSFRLNFELTAIVLGERIALSTERMFLRDFEDSREMTEEDIIHMPLVLRLASRLAYLLAPIQ
jgi:cardiolipin synthase